MNVLNKLGLIEVIQTLGVRFISNLCNFFNFKLNLELKKPLGILKCPQKSVLMHCECVTLCHSLKDVDVLIH